MVISSDNKPLDSPPDEDEGADEELGESIAKTTNNNEVTIATQQSQEQEASPIKAKQGKDDSYTHNAPIPPSDDPTQAHPQTSIPQTSNIAPWTRILGSPPAPAPRRTSIPGAHHVPGPGVDSNSEGENESCTSVTASINIEDEENDDHLNNELDRLGIHRAVAEAVPVNDNDNDDSKSDVENIGNDEQGDNGDGGSGYVNNNQDIFYTADPITINTVKILGREVPSSILKSILIACGVSLVMFAVIITPVMVVMSNNKEDQKQEQSMMAEKSMPAVPPPEETYLEDDKDRCTKNITECKSVNFQNIGKIISTEESLSDPTSPQYLSREWMLGQFSAPLPVKAGQRRWLQERYILGVLYHTTGGMDWFKSEDLIESKNHCNNDAGTIICDEDSRVVEIHLGTVDYLELYPPGV